MGMNLTLAIPWGNECFQMPFVVLPGPNDLVFLGQTTLWDVSSLNMMSFLHQTVRKLLDMRRKSDTSVDTGAGADDSGENIAID